VIHYNLVCDKRHEFESWFPSSAAYERQEKRKLIACPVCGSVKVERAIMAPNVARKDKSTSSLPAPVEQATEAPQPVAMVSPEEKEFRAKLKELRDHLTANSDNVGNKFPEEARKMHYGETEHRSIYGEATAEDAKALHEEGIEFHPLPVLPDDRN
jgi:hypothetical protein